MTDSPLSLDDDALGRKLAEALAISDRLLQARQTDEAELEEQLEKLKTASTAAAQKAQDRLQSRLLERTGEREYAEQIQQVLSEVSALGGGLLKRATDLEAEANAEREIAAKDRETAKHLADEERAAAATTLATVEGERATERAAAEADRAASAAAAAEAEAERTKLVAELEETATAAARAMEEIRHEAEAERSKAVAALTAEGEEHLRRVDDLQLLVKVKTEMLEKFEKVLGDRDRSIESLIADVHEKGESMDRLQENLKALRADYIAKENSAAAQETKASSAATVVDTLKNELSKVSEERTKLETVLVQRSKTIDELQALVNVLSGDTDVEFASEAQDTVSLPGGLIEVGVDGNVHVDGSVGAETPEPPAPPSVLDGQDSEPWPVVEDAEAAMPAPVDVGSLPDVPVTRPEFEDSDDDGQPDILIEEEPPHQTGEIAKAAALAAAIAQGTAKSVGDDSGGEGWASAVDGPDASSSSPLEDPVEDNFFGLDLDQEIGTNADPGPVAPLGSLTEELDLGDIAIEEDIPMLDDSAVVQKTDALDAYDCKTAEEIKLAGILSHQPWRVEEVTKLTKLDGIFVREKLTEFARGGLIEIING